MKPEDYATYLIDGLVHLLVILTLLYLINRVVAYH